MTSNSPEWTVQPLHLVMNSIKWFSTLFLFPPSARPLTSSPLRQTTLSHNCRQLNAFFVGVIHFLIWPSHFSQRVKILIKYIYVFKYSTRKTLFKPSWCTQRFRQLVFSCRVENRSISEQSCNLVTEAVAVYGYETYCTWLIHSPTCMQTHAHNIK